MCKRVVRDGLGDERGYNFKEVMSESIKLAKENKCNLFLADYSEATPKFSTAEIYDFAKLTSGAASSLNIHAFQIKRAIVMSKDQADYDFSKTIALNRGQNLELFDDIEKARNWLKNK